MGDPPMRRAVLSWSGGKDSSLCMHEIRQSGQFDIVGLLTTVTGDYDRISMHGVRTDLLLKQSLSLRLPLNEVVIPKQASNEIYEEKMSEALTKLKKQDGVSDVIFGDLFLQDIRKYRERFLDELDMTCVFPIWGKNTKELANYFIDSGFRAIICCVDPKRLGEEYCGREFDRSFLSNIPKTVDPCGENGEFHTFVYDGPIFRERIDVRVGEVVNRDGFSFADVLVA